MPTRLPQGGKPRKFIDSNHVYIFLINSIDGDKEAAKALNTARVAEHRGDQDYGKMLRHGVNLYRAKKLVEANA